MRKKSQSDQKASADKRTSATVDFEKHPEVLAAIDREVERHESSRAAQIRVICREWAKQRTAS